MIWAGACERTGPLKCRNCFSDRNTRYSGKKHGSYNRMMFPKVLKNKEKINEKNLKKRC